jgi:hypothetical protein
MQNLRLHQQLACSFHRNTARKSVDMCVYSEIIDANFASKQAIAKWKMAYLIFCVEISPQLMKIFQDT